MRVKSINHIALHVRDLGTSIDFYHHLLEFELLKTRPNFDFNGAWLRLGVAQELHLIVGRDYDTNGGSRKTHFALEVDSVNDIASFLATKKIAMVGPKLRPDGAVQLFICDPDGYWIEFTELVKSI